MYRVSFQEYSATTPPCFPLIINLSNFDFTFLSIGIGTYGPYLTI